MKINYNRSFLLTYFVSVIIVVGLLFLNEPYDKAHGSYSQIPNYSYLKFSESNYGNFNQIEYQSTYLQDLSSLVSDFNINYFENSDNKEIGNEESGFYQQAETTFYDIPFPSSLFSNANEEQEAFDYFSSPLVSSEDETNINSESSFSSDSMDIIYSPVYSSSPLTDSTTQPHSALTSSSFSSSPDSIIEDISSSYQDFPLSFLTEEDYLGVISDTLGEVVPKQYIVVLEDDDVNLSQLFSKISLQVDIEGTELLHVYENVLNGFTIRVPNEHIIDLLEKSPMVDYVEEDVIMHASAQKLPTGINRVDGDLSSTRSGNGGGGGGVVNVDIAILDTGIDPKHSDLNVYHQKNFISDSGLGSVSTVLSLVPSISSSSDMFNSNSWWSKLFGSGTSSPPPSPPPSSGTANANDDNGHGTHVAGIAAAKDNSIGSVGIAPGAKLWAIKVLDSKGSGPLSTIIKGIDYIAQYSSQIEVANLSLGCQCSSTALDTALNNAVNRGITFVVSGGNAGKDAFNFSPANHPKVISVSSIGDSDGKCGGKGVSTGYGRDDSLASFSNYGSVIDIAAPGTKIYSTYKGNSYAMMSGTSMASPHVAGAAALYLASNPGKSPSEVKNSLLSTGSTQSTKCNGLGYGYFSNDKDSYREPLLYVRKY